MGTSFRFSPRPSRPSPTTCGFSGRRGLLAGLLALAGCVKPYSAPVADSGRRYVVVDGFINPRGVSTFTLTRTLGLVGTQPGVETRATVRIEDEAGATYPLTEGLAGTYQSATLALDASRRYRLVFTTQAGQRYQSDLVPVQVTPPIDDVTWKFPGEELQLYVSAHDATNQTRYYRWNYQETWQFTSAFYSHLVYRPVPQNDFVVRTDNIYNCWRSATSTAIILGNTATLSQDVLSEQPLRTIGNRDDRLRYRYSILVQQMAQTADEYRYWELLKGNTENIGSLYDPLPTQLTGNVHNVADLTEPVLGYVGAHTVTEKRVFIDRTDLPIPLNWQFNTGYESCGLMPQQFNPFDAKAEAATGKFLPIDPVYDGVGNVIGCNLAPKECVDCRLRGTNVKPAFWQ